MVRASCRCWPCASPGSTTSSTSTGSTSCRGVERSNGTLTVRSMTRQADVEHDTAAGEAVPLLAQAIPLIGHFQIRNRGTVGWLDRPRRPRVGAPGRRARPRRRARGRGPERHPPRPGRRVLPRHLDHHRRGRRDPQRGALPGVAGPGRLRGRGGRAPQRRLRPRRRRRRGRAQRQRARSSARRSPSSGWRPLRCGPAPRRPSSTAPRPARPTSRRSARLAVTDTDPTADVHASAEYRQYVGAHLVERALDRALGAARRG